MGNQSQEEKRDMRLLQKKSDIEEQIETYTDEISEQSLSYEQLLQSALISDILKKTLVPKEIMLVAPLFISTQKAQEAKEEEAKKQESTSKNQIRNSNKMEMSDKTPESEQEEEEMSVAQALKNIQSPEFDVKYPAFSDFKKKFLPLLTPEHLSLFDSEPQQKNGKVGEVLHNPAKNLKIMTRSLLFDLSAMKMIFQFN